MMVMSGGLIPHPSGRGFIRMQNIPGVGAQASRGKIQMAGKFSSYFFYPQYSKLTLI